MTQLNQKQKDLCSQSEWDFSDLSALFINCTLKRSPEVSHTEGLMKISQEIMKLNGVQVEFVRAVDENFATGVWPDMREHGWKHDGWPAVYEKVKQANILIVGTPIWLGEKSSVCTQVVERLYATSGDLNQHGQYAYYGKVAGCLVTGNEDGIKHCAMSVLYALQHIGYSIPPQADAGWIGEAGARAFISRQRVRRSRKRFHKPQHNVYDLELNASRAYAKRCRRNSRPRQSAFGMGRRLSL